MVDGGDLLGGYGGVPGAGEDGGDDLEGGGALEEGLGEGDGLVLVGGAVGGGEADLGEGVFDSGLFGGLGVAQVGGEVPGGVLGDLGYYEAARDVGDPVAGGVRLCAYLGCCGGERGLDGGWGVLLTRRGPARGRCSVVQGWTL